MGYYTHYTFEVKGEYSPGVKYEDIEAAFNKISSYNLNDLEDDTLKWYDCEKDMIQLSLQFPKMIFYLYGDGEESDDEWEAYFYKGVCDQQQVGKLYMDNPFSIPESEKEEKKSNILVSKLASKIIGNNKW